MRTYGFMLARFVALIIAAGAGLASLLLSESSFFLASGSDAGVTIYTPALWAKLIALALFTVAVYAALFARAPGGFARVGVVLMGVGVLALGTHAFVFNNKRGVIEEYWLLGSVDRAEYDVADGFVDWTVLPTLSGFQLRHKRTARSVTLFCGVPPWRLDPARSLN